MSDLITYLRARLADEDALAVIALGFGMDNEWPFSVEADDERAFDVAEEFWLGQVKPSRVLADIAAKRAAIDKVAAHMAKADRTQAPMDYLHAGAGLEVLEIMAQAYADRDDFDDDWRMG